jgi:hypothetical protein
MRGVASSAAVAGLAGVPWCGLMPTPENANSVMLVWPVSAAPAARRARDRGAVGRPAARRRAHDRRWSAALHVEQVLDAHRQPASGGSGAAAWLQSTASARGPRWQRATKRGGQAAGAARRDAPRHAWRCGGSRDVGARALEVGVSGVLYSGFIRRQPSKGTPRIDKSRTRLLKGVSGQESRANLSDSSRILDPTFGVSMTVSMREMLEAGVHFGHQTRFWNPKMAPYIYGHRNKIHIINLEKTQPLFNDAMKFVRQLAPSAARS